MWNRSLEVTLTPSAICGAFVRGVIAANRPSVLVARMSKDATKLVGAGALARARSLEAGSPGYLALHRFDFAIAQAAIEWVRFDPKPKWGMGPVPHSGRLHVDLPEGKSRELILLGEQDGQVLAEQARARGYPVCQTGEGKRGGTPAAVGGACRQGR